MKMKQKLIDWSIKQCDECCMPGEEHTPENVQAHSAEWIPIGPPLEVQEALMQQGFLSDSVLEDGEAAYCQWVSQSDWAYRCTFADPGWDGSVLLRFEGLDTVADVYLNGKRIAASKTMYLPLEVDIGAFMLPENELLVYFHNADKMTRIYQETMPEAWKGIVPPRAMLRKSGGDFGSYLGAVPEFTPIGLFGAVHLIRPDHAAIDRFDMDVTFNHDYSEATIRISASGCADGKELDVAITMKEEAGPVVHQARLAPAVSTDGSWQATTCFTLSDPKLWWPKGYGDQPLYEMEATAAVQGDMCDRAVRLTGLREVKLAGSLRFVVNGTTVRLWGANIGPIGGLSHRWDPEPALKLIDMADRANMNALRLWGPSKAYGEELYLECDRRGFMLWQDFFTGSSQLPNNEEYRSLFLEEARHLVLRLRHHPSILVWCGGNENIYMTEYSEETGRIGHEILTHDFRKLCMDLDPDRYYHDTCPIGGTYTNDPRFGDTHGNRAYLAYMPGEQDANFFSEDIRTSPPALKSLERFISKEDLWPEGYADITSFGVVQPMPPAWARRIQNFAEQKFGPIEQYYDATDAASLVYKFGAAAGQSYYDTIAACRRGKPCYNSERERKCSGYLLWKLNNTWPAFYCGIVDFYLETHIPYFAVKRAFQPVFLNFDVQDQIHLWGVNDTTEEAAGTLTIRQFRLYKNEVVNEQTLSAAIQPGDSRILLNLDSFGFIRKDSVLHAVLTRSDGTEIARAIGFVDIERHQYFPEARLTLRMDGDVLELTTDRFARCVELEGDADGDRFGWVFEDNYFDLLPFETRRVKVEGKHAAGTVSAKAFYSRIKRRSRTNGPPTRKDENTQKRTAGYMQYLSDVKGTARWNM